MLFNSIEFAVFLPIVFILYWFIGKKTFRFQNILLLFASYYFYSCWDWRFLFLLLFSTVFDYFVGFILGIIKKGSKRSLIFWFSIVINVGILGYFKYLNFFVNSFVQFLSKFGIDADISTLQIILPVGISFYTFHGLSYLIDVYKNKISYEKDFISYALFVSYFPLLVAGPIERATHLLPQINSKRTFNYKQAIDGLRQILWGLFKKIVVADGSAIFVNLVFENSSAHNGASLLFATFLFAVQIYGDFSGYSDIAIGASKLFGIELLRNFSFPYFSRDIAEFWRRWHISLTTWFRDYIYIPLGGSKVGKFLSIRNTIIIFLISGFWHGANWTFILWGLYHAILFLPLILMGKNRRYLDSVSSNKILPSFGDIIRMIFTFVLVLIGWIFFRASTIDEAFSILSGIFNRNLFNLPDISGYGALLLNITILFITEWLQRNKTHGLEISSLNNICIRWTIYFAMLFLIFIFGGTAKSFIYFQF